MSKKTELDRLQKAWYDKLKDEGFKDIEADESNLKVPSSNFRAHCPQSALWDIKFQYYSMAEHFLNDYRFANSREHIIWEYHSKGISARNIGALLQQAKLKNTSRMSIFRTIIKLRTAMKAMYLSPHEDVGEQ